MIYSRINKIIDSEKLIENRIRLLQSNGFEVKRCYVPTYNKVGGITFFPRLKEFRIIIGRPKNHFVREVYAVVIKINR